VNREETLALWHQGKDAWEKWLHEVQEKRLALQEAGNWLLDWYGEGQNEETKAWLLVTGADFSETVFDGVADFAAMTFPGPVNFDGCEFTSPATFNAANFAGNSSFDNAHFAESTFADAQFHGFASFSKSQFDGRACFEKAKFLKSTEFAPCARFRQAKFASRAEFAGAQFKGTAEFLKVQFEAAFFDGCGFEGDALFTSAAFAGEASFEKARFSGTRVSFKSTVFQSSPRFTDAHFGGSWAELVISGACDADFEAARLAYGASFRRAQFVGECNFKNAEFGGNAVFDEAVFVMPAGFAPASFSGACFFKSAHFVRMADFTQSRFLKECSFEHAKFGSEASFDRAHFSGETRFEAAEFMGDANFSGVTAEAEFVFGRAKYVTQPNLAGAIFAAEPELGKLVRIKGGRRSRRLWSPWRKAEPRTGELELPTVEPLEETGEKAGIEPAPAMPDNFSAPPAVSGRLILRALFLWVFGVTLFVPFYLSQRPVLDLPDSAAVPAWAARLPAVLTEQLSRTAWHALGNGACVQGTSQPAGEALVLSLKNALVLVPWDGEATAQRVYGCLYGVEAAQPVISLAVTLAALLQALLSLLLVLSTLTAILRRREN
jgi:uncharacterized protein YjbI with pentapeptide repeats